MAKYYSFLFVLSIWFYTVLCVSAAHVAVRSGNTGTTADCFYGNLEAAFREISNIDQSSNVLVKWIRDTTKEYIDGFENDKKVIQNAVTEGTEMEKRIRNISLTLKNSTVTLPAELQTQLDEIGQHAAAELKKLKGVEDVNDIEKMHKRYKAKYTEIKEKIEALSKCFITEVAKFKQEKLKKQTTRESNQFSVEAKKKLLDFITTSVPVAFTMKKDAEAIFKKINAASSARSNIHDDLVKVEQMEYHLLGEYKDLFKTDFTSLTRSSMAQFAFAIVFGMLF